MSQPTGEFPPGEIFRVKRISFAPIQKNFDYFWMRACERKVAWREKSSLVATALTQLAWRLSSAACKCELE